MKREPEALPGGNWRGSGGSGGSAQGLAPESGYLS
jgi:hypothetical protein